MPVLPEGPIWFQHSSIKRKGYDPANSDDFYKYLLLELVVNLPHRNRQGAVANEYHFRTEEHTVGYEDRTLPVFAANQINYRKWKWMSVMYGPEAKFITDRIKLKSSVDRGNIVDRHGKQAPRTFLVPVRMPTMLERFLWLDLTFPLRAIYLPRQHQVDDGAYSNWCMFQHLSFRHRSLTFDSYVFSKEKEVTEEDRANLVVSFEGENFKSGDEYLLRVVERLGDESEDKESAAQSLSELKELQKKKDPKLRSALEKRLAELCDKAKYDKNEANRRWVKQLAAMDESIQDRIKDMKHGNQNMKDVVEQTNKTDTFEAFKGALDYETIAKKALKKLEKKREEMMAIPHEALLGPDEEEQLKKKMKTYEKAMHKTQSIDGDLEIMRGRTKMNTYTRKKVHFGQDYVYGWGIHKDYTARFDISLIYKTTMLPRGWLRNECQNPYCGVDIFSSDSINIPMDWGYLVKETYSNDVCCDIADVLSKEWGARLKYDDKPVEPKFIWGIINSIAQTGLGLVPGWGPLLVYGDTLLYNLIFTDTFSKVADGDRDSVAAVSMSTVALMAGVGPNLKNVINPHHDGTTQALLQMSMTTHA